MGEKAKPDFSGYATKAGLVCTDGRTITPDAFKGQDGQRVPLVWQHRHDDPEKVLGHAILYHRPDGMYTEGYFNDSPKGQQAKALVIHKDVEALSIWANQLIEKGKSVLHGVIKEVSLCLGGANPGAVIDNIRVAHSFDDDFDELSDEAIIYTGLPLMHSDQAEGSVEGTEGTENAEGTEGTENAEGTEGTENAEGTEGTEGTENAEGTEGTENAEGTEDDETTVQHAYDSMDNVQKKAVHFMVGAAVERTKSELEVSHSNPDKEGTDTGMDPKHNVFEQDAKSGGQGDNSQALSHSDLTAIVEDAKKNRTTLRDSFESYGLAHGITDIDVLFPQARNITDTPEFLSRRVEWVQGVLDGVKHSPFSRIRSLVADITFEEARAKGYVKGNLKKEEWISVSKRVTTPATIYKKQKLDRDDIIDITDFDVVVWLKAEMRLMFDEELARAILIGDGREVDDEDKVKDPAGASEGAGIRSIMNDHELYAPTVMVDDSATGVEIVDAITAGMALYKGSGGPTFYTTLPFLTQLLLTRDQFNHRLWKNREELATELGVSNIVTVEVMEDEPDLVGQVVNLSDYTIGADKGGEVNFFDFFDIDYNQYKYLYESRLSGALTKIRSAINFKRAAEGATLLTPDSPTFDEDTSAVTVPTQTHVKFYDETALTTDISGDTVTLDEGEVVKIIAVADSGYYFADNAHDEWTFQGVATS